MQQTRIHTLLLKPAWLSCRWWDNDVTPMLLIDDSAELWLRAGWRVRATVHGAVSGSSQLVLEVPKYQADCTCVANNTRFTDHRSFFEMLRGGTLSTVACAESTITCVTLCNGNVADPNRHTT